MLKENQYSEYSENKILSSSTKNHRMTCYGYVSSVPTLF